MKAFILLCLFGPMWLPFVENEPMKAFVLFYLFSLLITPNPPLERLYGTHRKYSGLQ